MSSTRASITQASLKASSTRASSTEQALNPYDTTILNQDPDWDYSFRPRKDFEHGSNMTGDWIPITQATSVGECMGSGVQSHLLDDMRKKLGFKPKSLILEDTIACKRPKEVSEHYRKMEDAKYNYQIGLLKNAATSAHAKAKVLRDEGSRLDVREEKGHHNLGSFTQRPGPTDEVLG
jgi:hypothetical protein